MSGVWRLLGRGRRATQEVERQLQAALGVPLRGVMAGRGDARRWQPVDQRAELELAQALRHRAAVVSAGTRRLKVQGHRQVRHDAPHLARQEGRLLVLGKPFAELPLHLVQVLVQGIERAELLEEGDGRLLPDPRHAWDVVGGVSL